LAAKPIIKDIAVDFHRMAASDVTAEYRLSEETITELLADLERKGSGGYAAIIPMFDVNLNARDKVTIQKLKLLINEKEKLPEKKWLLKMLTTF